MWIPAGLLCLPLYVLNIIRLLLRRYPAGQALRWKPVLLLLAALIAIGSVSTALEHRRRRQPMPTVLEAYHVYAPDARVLAEIPQGEDEVLIVSDSGSGVFVCTADGWLLQKPYQTDIHPMSGYSAIICRNPAEGEDVVILSRMFWNEDPVPTPTDTAGTAFAVDTMAMGPAILYSWYAVVDADIPGYGVFLE